MKYQEDEIKSYWEDLFSRIGCGELILPRKGLPFSMSSVIYTKYFMRSRIPQVVYFDKFFSDLQEQLELRIP